MKGLTRLERAVLQKILAGDHPLLSELRAQTDAGWVVSRSFTGVGFFTKLQPDPEAKRTTPRNFDCGDDVIADIPGVEHGTAFVLFVRDGLLDILGGVTFVGPWPDHIASFRLRYLGPPETGRGENAPRVVEVPTDDGPRWLRLPAR